MSNEVVVAAAAGGNQYCEVAVALPVHGLFTYAVPPGLAAKVVTGARVLVPFGGRGVPGVVVRAPAPAPAEAIRASAVTEVRAEGVPLDLLALALWIADYYEAPPGEALRLVVPTGTDESSAVVVWLTERGREVVDGAGAALPPAQQKLLAQLAASKRPTPRVRISRSQQTAALPALVAAGLVEVGDAKARARVQLKKERVVALAAGVDVLAAEKAVARAPRRLAVVKFLAAAAGTPVPMAALAMVVPGAAPAVKELLAAGIVTAWEREVSLTAATAGDAMATIATREPPTLTPQQAPAVAAMTDALGGTFHAFLLHGVTGSGKTEVYLRVIAEARRRGAGAIVLVPEISLTPQLAARFRARFGDEVAVLHSGLGDRERLGEWQRLVRGEARIALGARSAVFAPVADLGVVVVDEEHDGSFKQDEGVRYHGRDVALVRAQRAGAVCVLGSATPSMESYAAAQAGRYTLLSMPTRATGAPLPAVELVDLRTWQPDGEGMLSAPLAKAIEETLAAGDQTILFLNRRGFATFILCKSCGHSFRCKHCAVSLTYHKFSERLVCHYCDYSERVPETCPACAAQGSIERKGLGTERVAAALAERWPAARVARLDRDVATGAKAEVVLSRVARREVDILVGTQMVTKGHDFPGVTLVGVLCADLALSLPDFRAAERTFQLLAQVAGRSGRAEKAGRVIIQTYRPDVDAVAAAANHDYAAFFRSEDGARAELSYPPHGRLAAIRIDGPDGGVVAAASRELGQAAVMAARRDGDAVSVLGPTEAPLARLRGRTRWQIWLKSRDRGALRRVVRAVLSVEVKGVRVAADVDPLSAL
jgi:primosomal protein N' (replication factor Y)